MKDKPLHRVRALLVAIVASQLAGLPATAQDEAEALEAVRERIESLKTLIERRSADRASGARELQRIEEATAASAAQLASVRGQLQTQRAEVERLQMQADAARERILAERDALAESLRLSYILGREERLRLMLSQEEPATLGRMLGYYGYLGRARGERIDRVSAQLSEIERLTAAGIEARERLARLETEQREELERLERSRAERSSVLAKLDAEMAASGSEIENLEEEAQRLEAVIEEVAAVAAAFQTQVDEPFSDRRGRLPWPVDGSVTERFGSGSGPLRSSGLVLEAPRGTTVRSIHHGQVVFAGWLLGHGLSVIVSHGDGYMSMYGRNDVVLKGEGDRVSAGEAIAEVGETGGQRSPSLYFELRKDVEPFDPAPWMQAR